MPTKEDLKQKQALPLEAKIQATKNRIREWYEYWDGNVYVSFSGGKDSTVLLHIARQMYPDIEAVFINTGLEYPGIVEFVKTFDNVTILRPKMSFKQVLDKYGYPFISKNVSHNVQIARNKPNGAVKKNIFSPKKTGKYALYKWSFLLDAPFSITDKCCNYIKKNPAAEYEKKINKKKILATMANESILRKDSWLKKGCNVFEGKAHSTPMAFWTEQDVYLYIKKYEVPIASVYGDVVYADEEIEGQTSLIDESRPLTLTGVKRTGCIFCGFGCHLEKSPNRFERLKVTHPKLYEYCFKSESEGGLGYKDKIDWINEHGNMNIKY